MYRSSAHNHTTYADGRSTAREMIESALAHGFEALGFTEHLEFSGSICTLTPENEPLYRAEISALAEEYAGRIRIWLGVEQDAFSEADTGAYEYVIGSAHYVEQSGRRVAVDGNGEQLARDVRELFSGDGIAFARRYYDTLAGFVERAKPQIIGHADLLRKWNGHWHFFDPEDAAYRVAALDALERMIGSGALLEVNTGAMARGYLATPYPELFLLRRWRELGGQAIIGTDCHQAEKIAWGIGEACELCRAAGYRSVMTLGRGAALFEEAGL